MKYTILYNTRVHACIRAHARVVAGWGKKKVKLQKKQKKLKKPEKTSKKQLTIKYECGNIYKLSARKRKKREKTKNNLKIFKKL